MTSAESIPRNPSLGRVLGVIPARLTSTRLPRKVLRTIAGRPLLAWVVDAARACTALDDIIIATDSPEVESLCQNEGWRFLPTDPALASGTDRLYAVSRQISAEIYINIQGDEPLLQPAHIADILRPFTAAHIDVTTLKTSLSSAHVNDPNIVKVVTASDGRALYFSRSPIPFDRDSTGPSRYWKHLGLYAYRRAALARFASFAPSALEQIERLEQLRLLENGLDLYVSETAHDTIGVDTEDDLQRVEDMILHRTSR